MNDKKQGNGVFIYNNGRILDGEYSNGKFNGFGKKITPNRAYYGEFADSKSIKKIRNLTAEEVAETKQKVIDHEKEMDIIKQHLKQRDRDY